MCALCFHFLCFFFFSSRRRHTRCLSDWSSDVCSSDLLPGMNGVECVRRLKQLIPAVQVVMLTVYEDTDNIFNALAAGAAGYLRSEERRVGKECRSRGAPDA